MKIEKELFGKLSDGTQIDLYIIKHDDGSQIKITNYGATIVSLKVPDKNGNVEDVVLGFDKLDDYINIRNFYGCVVGRLGNRLANGKFSIDSVEYNIPQNEGANSLHGGVNGFDRMVWEAEQIIEENNPGIKLHYLSKDGEEGYPGNLDVTVKYTFSDNHELRIEYKVTTDKPTVKNITNHSYFNLSGNVKYDILNHELQLYADKFVPVREGLIPTGELRDVKNTPMDFRTPHKIGERINEDYEQLKLGLGYDQTWVFNEISDKPILNGSVYDPRSGRLMEIFTTEPGIQFYSGNFLDGSHAGLNGVVYKHREGMCLQTQHFPDSPNHPEFPSVLLLPGKVYSSVTMYKFSVKL